MNIIINYIYVTDNKALQKYGIDVSADGKCCRVYVSYGATVSPFSCYRTKACVKTAKNPNVPLVSS